MADNKVKIGFVGVGGMGQCAHLTNYKTIPDCDVVAIAEIRKNLAVKVAKAYDVPKVYSSYEEMLSNEKLDGLVASQQFTRHGIIVPELLKANIPVFTEKPIAGSVEMGEKIVKAVKKSKTFLMIGYHKRSDPAVMYAQKEIDNLKKTGELGKMKYVRILMPAGDWIAEGFSRLIKSEDIDIKLENDPAPKDMDSDSYKIYLEFVNYYIHQVNMMRHMLGESYRVTYADPSGVILAGQSVSGIPCVIEMSPYTTSIDWQESIFVCFEKGWIKIKLPAPVAVNRPGKVEIFKDLGNGSIPATAIPQFKWIHAMRQQAMNFISAIKGNAKPPCEAYEALEDLMVARQYLKLFKNV